MTRILVLGGSGLLGNNMIKYFSVSNEYEVFGTIRSNTYLEFFKEDIHPRISVDLDILDDKVLEDLIRRIKPDIILNCIGITNKISKLTTKEKINYINLNSLLPHRIYKICSNYGVRLIHFSTDCVFSGNKGSYVETDIADSNDFYGRSKYLGELCAEGSVTIRKSIIGHELNRKEGLLNWFLSQKSTVKGYTNAVFSGIPASELAYIIERYIFSNVNLSGLYHISSSPISKYELLKLISTIYLKKIDLIKSDTINIDRSLDSSLFSSITGYNSRPWSDMIKTMYRFNQDINNA